MPRSTQGHHLNKLGSTWAPDAAYQVSKSSAFCFQRRRFYVFTIYGHGCHLGHVIRTVWTPFLSPFPRRLHMKFGFNRPSGEDDWKCWHTQTHTCTYTRTTEAYLYDKLIYAQGELKMQAYLSTIDVLWTFNIKHGFIFQTYGQVWKDVKTFIYLIFIKVVMKWGQHV